MARISKEKQEEIRKKILEVSRQKFTDVGFDKISTKEIAKEVGIAEGTLFNYFDSKTEIFFETFGEEYEAYIHSEGAEIQISDDITDTIVNRFKKSVGLILKLPKGILGEFAIQSVKMAQKKPEKFKKLMAYDFQFIDVIAQYIRQLIDKGILKEVDHKQFSEMIFAIIGYELLLYMYEKEITSEIMNKNLKTKIEILVQGYIKGGK